MRLEAELEQIVLDYGWLVEAEILKCHTSPDPDDDEHTVYDIEYRFIVNGKVIKDTIHFSINTAHIAYAHSGQLFHVPKLDISVDDFNNALKQGAKADVKVLPEKPYPHVFCFTEKLRELMNYEQMWM